MIICLIKHNLSTQFNKIFILLNLQFINKTASRRFSSGAPAMPHGGSVRTDELSMLLASLHARPLSTK